MPPHPTSAPAFAAEPFVIRNSETILSFNPDGTGFREQSITVAVQSEAALHSLSVLGVPFAANSERVQIRYVRVRHPDGTVTETSPGGAIEQPEQVTLQAPLYSDLKQQQLPVKSLGVGDTLEWQVHIERFKPEAPGEFWGRQAFIAGAVVLAQSFELRVPSGRAVTVWTNPTTKLNPATSTLGTQRIYRWSTSSLAPTVGPEAEAAAKAKAKIPLTPDEQLDATEGKLPDIAWTSFPSWEAVGAWYRSLEAGRTLPNDAISAKVTELTAGKSTLDEKARAVYAFVSGQVRYVGVDFGIGRYQPHHAEEILDNQYGDCKDKHTLLAAMLAVLGLHPDAVLIGAGIRFNPAVPAPDNFNHAITHVVIAGQPVWLDSTEEVAPFRMMWATLRDKQALVVPDSGPATIVRTPPDPPFPTFEHMTASGSLDKDGVSESHFTLTQRGDEELLIRTFLRQVSAAQFDELTQRLVATMGFGGTVSHAQFLHVDDTSQPLVIEWDYHREKAGNDWENLRTVPQLMMVLLPSVDEKQPPIQDVQLLGARSITSTSQMKLPAGWSAELPEAVHASSEFGTYDLTFRYENGTLYADRRWTVLKNEVLRPDWKRYKAWMDEISPANEPYVQLRKPGAEKAEASPSAHPTPDGTSDADSVRLIADAYKAIDEGRLDEGVAFLDKAKALNPQQRNLWGDYGWVAFRRGDHREAMRLYQKELASYPDSLWAYQPLSQLQYMTGDHDAAIATMQRYVKQAPDNPDAAASLIALLLDAHHDTEAAAAADLALQHLPDDAKARPTLQLSAARAQLRGGEQQKGLATLTQLLNSASDPLIVNDAAYELAVANQDLSLAESAEKQALDKLATESRTWTLDESLTTLRSKSALLSASWDTMGWILFREGKFDQAEPYIQAGWSFHPSAEVGEHLGDVQLAQGHKAQALHSYRLALATISPYDMMGVHKTTPDPKSIELNARIAKLKDVPDPKSSSDGRAEFQAMRTIRLPSALDHDGVVQYKLLLSPGSVKRAEPLGDKQLAGGTDLLMKAKFPANVFPPQTDAVLMRLGTLNCHSGVCEMIFLP